ncbi:MAG TPA: helix-turn-helix domain-containing protein [Pseudonocardiaceae bacterium]|nr:helix-turn-helix domain-containing protein [Pseudonocardiaceae bacterium]
MQPAGWASVAAVVDEAADSAILAFVRAGATNAELADHLGVTTRTLCRWRAARPGLNEAIILERRRLAEARQSPHGSRARYGRGCRCPECTSANTAGHYEWAQRRRAQLGLPPPDPRRGRTPNARIGQRTVAGRREQIEQALARGETVTQIMARFGLDYAAVKTIRDELLAGAA